MRWRSRSRTKSRAEGEIRLGGQQDLLSLERIAAPAPLTTHEDQPAQKRFGISLGLCGAASKTSLSGQERGDQGTGFDGQRPPLFPIFLKLEGRRCLVVGGGRMAEGKIEGLRGAGGDVLVIAPRVTRTIAAWARRGKITWHQRLFRLADLRGVTLVVVATPSQKLRERIYQASRVLHIFCNAVDDPPHCDFYYPATVRRGDFQIALSTGGKSPALAQRLRKQFERQFSLEYGAWVHWLGTERDKLMARPMTRSQRRRRLHRLASQLPWVGFATRKAIASLRGRL